MSDKLIILDDHRPFDAEIIDTIGEKPRELKRYLLFFGFDNSTEHGAWDNLKSSRDSIEECVEIVRFYDDEEIWWEIVDLTEGCIVRRS